MVGDTRDFRVISENLPPSITNHKTEYAAMAEKKTIPKHLRGANAEIFALITQAQNSLEENKAISIFISALIGSLKMINGYEKREAILIACRENCKDAREFIKLPQLPSPQADAMHQDILDILVPLAYEHNLMEGVGDIWNVSKQFTSPE